MCSELRSLAVELAPFARSTPVVGYQWVRPAIIRRTLRVGPPWHGAEPDGADQRDEGHLLPRSRRAAVLVSSRDTRHLLKARLSHGLIRAAPVAGHPSRCDGTAEPLARWLGPRETPAARPQENRAAAFGEPSPTSLPCLRWGRSGEGPVPRVVMDHRTEGEPTMTRPARNGVDVPSVFAVIDGVKGSTV